MREALGEAGEGALLPNGYRAMQTNVREAVRDALTALIDYAGLFPPAQLEMRQAITEYFGARSGPYAWMLGRFIVPCSRVAELLDALPHGERCAVSVILNGGIADVPVVAMLRDGERRLDIETLEIAIELDDVERYAEALRTQRLSDLQSFVELRRSPGWQQTVSGGLASLARCGLSAKVRCGGVTADAFPSPAELAVFVDCAIRQRVAFKATAGLHHPVRHFNEASGFTMHGFLNVLYAVTLALRGEPLAVIERALASENAADFAFGGSGITGEVRRFFAGYGSCSFAEPVDDLRAMGVLA